MKTITILFTALLITGLSFGQMKYKPKVVVVVLGPKNATFDESRFSDLKFYYLPDLKLKISKKAAANNTSKHAWSSALGMGRTANAENHDFYIGKPEALINHEIHTGTSYIFDKNGRANAEILGTKEIYFNSKTKFMVGFNKMKRSWETESFGDLMKSLVKKGETMKPPKKSKSTSHLIGKELYAFQAVDKDGNEVNVSSLIKGNPATLLVFLYISPEYDFNQGKESGAGKKGRTYMNQVSQTVAADKQIAPLYDIERGIFGKRIEH